MARTSVRRLEQRQLQVAFLRDSMLVPGNDKAKVNDGADKEPEWKERLRRWKLA